ncbi:MAG: DUF3990 domain-containing protein [Clostridiales bacterium]|nr:DUF3990 domain-containing protein [Clostridiales bacterium]
MIVYHGSNVVVKTPDMAHSYRPLDFGKGFYVTTNKEQAIRWARRKADLKHSSGAYVNSYEMTSDFGNLRVKKFSDDLTDWIDFVCACRDGGDDYKAFDIIIGKVADDKVFRVVDMYRLKVWDKERAIKEIKVYPGYDQIVFVSQTAIDKMLKFIKAEEV